MLSFSDIDVCSNALVLLGQNTISSLTEDDKSPQAKICAVRYPVLRLKLMASHPWNFTINQAQLSLQVETPSHQWKYQYGLPADILSDGVLALYETSAAGRRQYLDFVSQRGLILANVATMYIDYQKNTDETLWPNYYTDLMAHVLAADIAFAITRKTQVQQDFNRIVYGPGGELQRAKALDAKAAPQNNTLQGYPIIDARFGRVRDA